MPINPSRPCELPRACIAFGPRAGQKVLSLRTVPSREKKAIASDGLCAQAHGISLRAAVRMDSDHRKRLERLCRCITRPAIANGSLWNVL